MFTGIIEEIGIIRNIVKGSRSIKLTITDRCKWCLFDCYCTWKRWFYC